ncbi:hypothetical protein AMJ49_05435 [Parcubacteria bacterium DG_74_2]|nr:MAG: hypothetical protein AMJ49_05435 [Parcubacteria bacterium DG_74_2]
MRIKDNEVRKTKSFNKKRRKSKKRKEVIKMGKEINKEELISDTEIIERQDELNQIYLELSEKNEFSSNYYYEFRDSDIRTAIKELGFDIESTFFFSRQ